MDADRHRVPASTMGPPFRQVAWTTSGATSTDEAMMDHAEVMVKEAHPDRRRW